MTRRVVAIEGKRTRDGRLLNPGSIKMNKDVIPVGAPGYTDVIGKAGWFVRNDETGEISLDIVTNHELIDNFNVHISLYNLVVDEPYDGMTMVIQSGTLMGIFVSLGESAWPELNRKEA